MSRDDHAVDQVRARHGGQTKTKDYYSADNIAIRVGFGTQASVHDSDHYDVDRIFVGLSWELHCRIVCSSDGERRGEFLHNYYMFVSLHDSDQEGVVRIFVALSCELWLFIYLH